MKKQIVPIIFAALMVLMTGCIHTQDDHHVAGMPLTKDRLTSRYARPVSQLADATRTVLKRNGKILVDNVANNSFAAVVNGHHVWVKITDVDGKVSEVVVQARGFSGDVDTAAEMSKQIGMVLVSGANGQ